MTLVTFPQDSVIYPEAIKINGGSIPPGSVAPGELYLDEEHRLLYVDTSAGLEGVPLDVVAVPPLIDRTADDSLVLVRTTTGAVWDKLDAGGGGTIYDNGSFRVPGLAPSALGVLVLPAGAGGRAIFEMSQPGTIVAIGARAKSGSGAISFSLHAWNGALGPSLITQNLSFAGVEAKVANISVALDAGQYAWTWTSTATLTLETVEGFLPWSKGAEAHPAFMQVA
ncbi:hypothetical protein CcrC1_gp127 [Caulobacter phage C1]|nr:hypothetical protein CcrC1_gp127 [Caulobacter phage C1]UTU08356.1 hypothetical protein CcrC2_gp128 [Caulobacter phage C2]UTU08873.1 hypothetical protein CcrJ4_gp122 [Caulobacter phage J4]UTU09429.1 hypothetical protein CcrBL47_gp143 [Caulobacter phage BL47]UTU09989.1 hypothetical protein CcrRB23_gp127 [Caulobacter phage RB23]WGN97014.1 hypothetical protein [Bertelyvirus sp.]